MRSHGRLDPKSPADAEEILLKHLTEALGEDGPVVLRFFR